MKKVKNLNIILFLFTTIFLHNDLYAKDCESNISGTDMMKFDKKIINVNNSSKYFNILLKHTGKLQKI